MTRSGPSRLALGTVQFGLDYGITNVSGRVDEQEAALILASAARSGLQLLDTAHLYGESEAVIGRSAPDPALRIVTKTPKFGQAGSAGEAVRMLRHAFEESLAKLHRPAVHALLLHDPADLIGPYGGALWAAMESLKAEGLIEAIGLSVYEGGEIDEALRSYPIDLVQLPWNVIDDRLDRGGQLARLAERNIRVHARSLFLQGLLLQEADRIPERFAPIRDAVKDMDQRFGEAGMNRLEGILAIAFARAEIEHFIVGVTSRHELDALLAAARSVEGAASVRLPRFDIPEVYLNPARWGELV